MSDPRFDIRPARTADDLAAVATLFRAYAEVLGIDLAFQNFAADPASLPGPYAPPAGELLLARDADGRPIGCVGLRPIASDGCCEMKRLCVSPDARGLGLGSALVAAVIEAARRMGHGEIRLDTLPEMGAAQALYRKAGFAPISAYDETPIRGTLFMARRLDGEAGEPAPPDEVAEFLRAALADPEHGWSLGSFGALAEFARAPDEPFTALGDGRLGLATARGAIALQVSAGLRPVAYETAFGDDWSHAVALCLPDAACAMGRRTRLTELGPDPDAARPEDRGAVLFDLGLGLSAVDACLRTRDSEALATLRAAAGRTLLDPGDPLLVRLETLAAHRVFVARPGRIEVFATGGVSAGPRAFLAPRILRSRRTHAATAPIPPGLVPFGACHPAHPWKDRAGRAIPCRPERHAAFQALLSRWGDPRLLAIKQAAEAGSVPGATDRHARAILRVVRAQAARRRNADAGSNEETPPCP